MQNMKVTLVQANQAWEDKVSNLENYTELLQSVKDTDLIILPEMFHTGFTMNSAALYETMNKGIGINWLKEIAREKSCAIYTSLIILENGHFYNRGVFIYPDGRIHHYDKRKTFSLAGENEHFSSGRHEVILRYREWNIQLQICYDLRFPEIVRNRILPDRSPAYDLILYVANWPEKRTEHWKVLLKARAIENQCYVAGVNRVGNDGVGITYSGDSRVIDANGEEISLESGIQTVQTIELNWNNLKKTREILPFLKDRNV